MFEQLLREEASSAEKSVLIRRGTTEKSRTLASQETTSISILAKFYSPEDFQKQLAVHNRNYNNFPMRPLGWKSPQEVLRSFALDV